MLLCRKMKGGDEEIKRRGVYLHGLFLFCLLLPLLASAGCWDRREPSFLGVVTSVAFDYDPQTDLLQVIAEVANPLGISTGEGGGQNGGGGTDKPFWVVEASGRTVYEAIKKTEQVSTRKLIWSHLEVVLFSEEMAKKGLHSILDYIDRERQARLIARPFVVQGDIRELMGAEFPLEQLGGTALIRQLLTLRLEDAVVPEIDSLRRLFHHLSVPGVELILPRIVVQVEKEEGGGGAGGGDEKKTRRPGPAKISGAALFRGDKLAGFFNDKETAGYLWLTNNIRRLTMVFPPPGEGEDKENKDNKFLTVEVFWAANKLQPEVQGERVKMHLSVRAEARLQDYGGQDLPQVEEFKRSLNRRLAMVIHNQIGMAWLKAQTLNLDVFGFGHELYKTRPRDWKHIEKKWAEIFPEIELEVDVRALIRSYGLVTEPITVR